jgi:hypothetical protein
MSGLLKAAARTAAVACIFSALLLVTSCGGNRNTERDRGDAGTQQAAEVRVSDLNVGRRVNSAHQIETMSDRFAPGDTVWASVRTENAPAGSRILTRWVYTEGGSEQIVAEETHTTAMAGTGYTSFFVANPVPWPAGSYEVRVSLDGEVRQTKEFRVEG